MEGAAGPAPPAVSAAGLFIMAKVPVPTGHVHHPPSGAHGQGSGQVGAVCCLLAGPGLYVAGIAGWAAVLAVLTAHSLGDKGISMWPPSGVPPPTGQAGYSHGAAGSRPSPRPAWGSRSGPRGSWHAGRSLRQLSGTGTSGEQPSSPVPACPPPDSVPRPCTNNPGDSSAHGWHNRQPGQAKGVLGYSSAWLRPSSVSLS